MHVISVNIYYLYNVFPNLYTDIHWKIKHNPFFSFFFPDGFLQHIFLLYPYKYVLLPVELHVYEDMFDKALDFPWCFVHWNILIHSALWTVL